MKIREHLSYSNVAATIALVVALGTGGAYAAGEIGSGEIDNDSIRSKDLRDRKAVKSKDVKRDGLTGNVIKERTLDAGAFSPVASDNEGSCNPTDSVFVDCARTSVTLPARGRILVIATGNFFSQGGPADLACRIAIDGVNRDGSVTPGEVSSDNTEFFATDGFAQTHLSGRLSRGNHPVALRCSEESGDGRLAASTVSVLGVSGG